MAGHELGCLLTSKSDLGRKGGPGSRLDGWGVEAGGGEGGGAGWERQRGGEAKGGGRGRGDRKKAADLLDPILGSVRDLNV